MTKRTLSRAQLLAHFDAETHQHELRRRSRCLAASLIHLLEIPPHGIHLICFIADTSFRSNADALADWVFRQISSTTFRDELAEGSELDLLMGRLNCYLISLEAANV